MGYFGGVVFVLTGGGISAVPCLVLLIFCRAMVLEMVVFSLGVAAIVCGGYSHMPLDDAVLVLP